MRRTIRTLALWCPDWPVTAGIIEGVVPPGRPAVVVRANRVVAASPSARAEGVRRGMRRREAQAACPDVEVLSDDASREARAFEPIVAAVEVFTPLVEIVRPGLCQLATRGPSRYFGGDEALTRRALVALEQGVGRVGQTAGSYLDPRIGVADGPFAAAVAARMTTTEAPVRIVAAGETPLFLASMPVAALPSDLADMAELMTHLGIHSLGALATLPDRDMLARFGPAGVRAQLLARGLDPDAPRARVPPPELTVQTELDPPVERVDMAAFVGRSLAEELCERLAREGLACTCIRIDATLEDGTEVQRRWRHERAGAPGGLTPGALADRVRWQLEGWLVSRRTIREHGTGIVLVRLVPEEVVADEGRQLGLWGGPNANDERASRAFARVQGLLGPDAVATAVPTGGRSFEVQLCAWGDRREAPVSAGAPWPGRLPSPLPTIVHRPPLPATVIGEDGRSVCVSGRGEASSAPATVRVDGETRGTSEASEAREARGTSEVVAWAGPWLVDERWWDLEEHRRKARYQLQTADGQVYLAVLEGGDWWIEAQY